MDTRVRIYARTSDTTVTRPGLVYFHGGGGVVGDLDTHDEPCRVLADRSGCVVVSVDYRLGPEEPFPAAVDDALAAFRWVVADAHVLGIDPDRVAVGGDSMGGNLSAVVSQLARDDGGPRPCFQLLVYPATDRTKTTRSGHLFADGFFLTDALTRWFYAHYAGGVDPTDPRISPLLAQDVRDVAPALIVTAGFDPLRDEGEFYARRLREAGVDVRYRCYRALIHGFIQMTGVVPAAAVAMHEIADELAGAMHAASRPATAAPRAQSIVSGG
jgi:acetyl esterase